MAVDAVFGQHLLLPPAIPSPVLVECMTGDPGRDTPVQRFVNTCTVVEVVPMRIAKRAAWLRSRAGRGSAVDAIVVAMAEPDGIVMTTDIGDIRALAASSNGVTVERI